MVRACRQRASTARSPRSWFLTEFYVTVARWIDWATTIVDMWPDDVNDAPFDEAAAKESVALAESVETILSAKVDSAPRDR